MEINITSLITNEADLWPCYGSDHTHGIDSANHTWNAAKDLSGEIMFVSDINRDELRDHFRSYGAWDDNDIDNWTDIELNALLIQDICGSLSDIGINLDLLDFEDDNLRKLLSENDSRIFLSENNLYFYIGE